MAQHAHSKPPPDHLPDMTIEAPTGHQIHIHDHPGVAGAFLVLGPSDSHHEAPSLSLVAEAPGRVYVGYRDGKAMADRLAISVDDHGGVTLYVVLPGDGPEADRVRLIPLDHLDRIAALLG